MIRPVLDRIVVQEIKKGQTKSGIIIPETHRDPFLRGEVVSVGPGRYSISGELIPVCTNAGDVVIFDPRAAHAIDSQDKEYFLIRETDVLCVEYGSEA